MTTQLMIQHILVARVTAKLFAYPIRLAKHMHVRCLEKVSFLGVPPVHDAIASEWGL